MTLVRLAERARGSGGTAGRDARGAPGETSAVARYRSETCDERSRSLRHCRSSSYALPAVGRFGSRASSGPTCTCGCATTTRSGERRPRRADAGSGRNGGERGHGNWSASAGVERSARVARLGRVRGDPAARRSAPAGGRRGRLAALADREWLLFEREHALSQLVERLCAAEGFTPCAAVRSAQIAGVAALAAAGLGPALVPANIVTSATRGSVRTLDPPRARELCAFTRAAWSPLARAFLDLIAEQPWPQRQPGTAAV
jgi:hypothetical protein